MTASPSDHGFIFTLSRSGTLLLTTGDRQEAAARMLSLSIEVPEQLLGALGRGGNPGGGYPGPTLILRGGDAPIPGLAAEGARASSGPGQTTPPRQAGAALHPPAGK